MWYRTGTINLTNGSKNITGTGTLFNSNVKSGFALLGPDFSVYEVDNVSSDTAFTIKENYRGTTASDATYAIFQTQGIIKDLTDNVTALINTFGAFRDAYNNGDLVGQGLELKGILNSPADLPSSPAVGDAYLIGISIYVYSGSTGGWENSNIAGIIPKGAWNAGTAYSVNDTVTYQGSQYRRKVAGTTSTAPDADTTNWDLFVSIGQTGPAGVNATGLWNSATAYAVNDLAQYNGSQYRRIVAGTTNTDPPTDTTNWQLFVSKGLDGLGSVVKVNNVSPDLDGNVTVTTDNISEGSTNIYFTATRVINTALTGLSTSDSSDVAATDTVLSGFGKLQAKWANISTTIMGTVLTGLSVATSAAVAATDSILAAIGKLQAQINTINSKALYKSYASAGQTLAASTAVKISFNTITYDTASAGSSTLYRFVAPVAGKYSVKATLGIAMGSSTSTFFITLYKNGAASTRGTQLTGTVDIFSTINTDISLASGDYVEIFAFSGISATTYSGASLSDFCVSFLG